MKNHFTKKLLNILCITLTLIFTLSLFSGCTPKESPVEDFEYKVHNDSTVSITKYIGAEKDVVIPSKIEGMPVTIIASLAFYESTIETIIIPNTIIAIQDEAFSCCSNLKAVDFGTSLEEISHKAFFQCTSLEKIDLPDTLKTIDDAAFSGCTSLASVKLGKALERIDSYAFANCVALTEIVIPTTVEYLGDQVFASFLDYSLLTTIYFEGNAPTVNQYTFTGIGYEYKSTNGEQKMRTPLDVTFYYKKGTAGWNEGAWLELMQNEKYHFIER